MSLQTIKIANCAAYVFRYGAIQPGERVDTDIFIPGKGEMASQTTLGVSALKKHGQPKFFGYTWPKRIVVAIQYPNLTYNATLIDAIVKAVKALPNVGNVYAMGLSQGAIYWGKYLSGDDGTRAKQFAGCLLMSGSGISTAKAANFKNLKTILFAAKNDPVVSPANYRSVYKTFKAAGVDITYNEVDPGTQNPHSDVVWNHFSPATKIYEKLTTPQNIIVPQEIQAMTANIFSADTTLDGTQKKNIYDNQTAGATVTLPDTPKGEFDVMLRNRGEQVLNFNKDLWYGDTEKLTSLGKGVYNIFFDTVRGKYFVIHNE
jgi:hypothetical protein